MPLQTVRAPSAAKRLLAAPDEPHGCCGLGAEPVAPSS